MNKQHTNTRKVQLSAYNMEVKAAYFKVLKQTKQLLATIERHELRYTYVRNTKDNKGFITTVNELISPLLYLSLEWSVDNLTISYGFECFNNESEYTAITAKFVRLLYKLTSTEQTTLDIEECIDTEYVNTDCSALYEAIEDSNNKQHSFSLIAYKPTAKRKQLKAVA
jgi:hypothetical protein